MTHEENAIWRTGFETKWSPLQRGGFPVLFVVIDDDGVICYLFLGLVCFSGPCSLRMDALAILIPYLATSTVCGSISLLVPSTMCLEWWLHMKLSCLSIPMWGALLLIPWVLLRPTPIRPDTPLNQGMTNCICIFNKLYDFCKVSIILLNYRSI